MTLLVAVSSAHFSLLVADRRISMAGVSKDDEFNKVIVLFCDDARVAVAFTGLASCGPFNTRGWLWETLAELGKSTHCLLDIIAETGKRLSTLLLCPPLSGLQSHDKQLTLLFCGFSYDGTAAIPVTGTLTNSFDIAQPFVMEVTLSPTDPIRVLGAKKGLTPKDDAALREILLSNAPPEQVERRAIRAIRKAASENPLIGKQCNGAIIPAAPDSTIVSTYHSASATGHAFGADVVMAVSSRSFAVQGVSILSPTVLVGPPINKNRACWCGSGQKFKHCHLKSLGSIYGQMPPFRRPLPLTVRQIAPLAVASGRAFIVASGFT